MLFLGKDIFGFNYTSDTVFYPIDPVTKEQVVSAMSIAKITHYTMIF